jgi:WD40 repeat protein
MIVLDQVGEMAGHTKRVTSVSYKQQRPYRIMSCGDDMKVQHYEGPPFKMKKSEKCHTNFVNCIKHSPDGTFAVSVGSDKNTFFYDGKTVLPLPPPPSLHLFIPPSLHLFPSC